MDVHFLFYFINNIFSKLKGWWSSFSSILGGPFIPSVLSMKNANDPFHFIVLLQLFFLILKFKLFYLINYI